MRQLLPSFNSDVNLGEAYGVVRQRHESGRPTIGLCMVMSIDGSTVVEGRSTLLSNPTDRDVIIALRAVADTIVVGAGTIREQMYTPPSKRGLRVGVVTRTANLDFDSPLFKSGAGFLIMPQDAKNPTAVLKLK